MTETLTILALYLVQALSFRTVELLVINIKSGCMAWILDLKSVQCHVKEMISKWHYILMIWYKITNFMIIQCHAIHIICRNECKTTTNRLDSRHWNMGHFQLHHIMWTQRHTHRQMVRRSQPQQQTIGWLKLPRKNWHTSHTPRPYRLWSSINWGGEAATKCECHFGRGIEQNGHSVCCSEKGTDSLWPLQPLWSTTC